MNIIQHHKPIDFEVLFKQLENATIGIDGRDWEVFAKDAVEIHSFSGSAELDNRVLKALNNAIGSDEATAIINKCKKFMLIVRHNLESYRPVMMNEISAISEFVSRLSHGSDILWSWMQDSNLGNTVRFSCCAT